MKECLKILVNSFINKMDRKEMRVRRYSCGVELLVGTRHAVNKFRRIVNMKMAAEVTKRYSTAADRDRLKMSKEGDSQDD